MAEQKPALWFQKKKTPGKKAGPRYRPPFLTAGRDEEARKARVASFGHGFALRRAGLSRTVANKGSKAGTAGVGFNRSTLNNMYMKMK